MSDPSTPLSPDEGYQVRFACHACGQRYQLPERFFGHAFSCQNCGVVLLIPNVVLDDGRMLGPATPQKSKSGRSGTERPQDSQPLDPIEDRAFIEGYESKP